MLSPCYFIYFQIFYQCVIVNLNPVVIFIDAPGLTLILLQIAVLELMVGVPLLMITSVLASGTVPQLQLLAVSQRLFTAPVHVLATCK